MRGLFRSVAIVAAVVSSSGASGALAQGGLTPVQIYSNGAPVSSGNGLPINGSITASLGGFLPAGSAQSLSVTATSAAYAIGGTSPNEIVVQNTGANSVYFTLSIGAGIATTSGYLVQPGFQAGIAIGTNTYINVIGAGASTLNVVPGVGLPVLAGGGGGGSGGAVNLNQVGGAAYALGQASMAASMPIVIASNQSAVPVSGTVTAAQATAANLNATVVQSAGANLHVDCDSGCSSSSAPADESTFTPGTTSQTPTGGFYQTTPTSNPLTTGQMGAFQVTANRALFANLRNSSGTEIGTASTPVQVSLANTAANATAILTTGTGGTFPATQSGTWSVNLGTIGSAATAANQTSVQGTVGAGTAPADMVVGGQVYNSSTPAPTPGQALALQSDPSGNLKVNVQAAIGLAQGSTTSGQTGSLIMGTAVSAAPTDTAGDSYPVTLDLAGNLRINCITGCAGGAGGTSATDEATFTQGTTTYTPVGGIYTTSPTALTTGQAGVVRLTASRFMMSDLETVAGAALALGQTTMSASLPVTIASNPGSVPISAAALPLPTGGATAANQTVAQGATGSAVPADAHYAGAVSSGNLTGIIQADKSVAINVSTATTTSLVGLSGTTKIYVTSFDVVAGGTGNITFEYGTGANCGTGTTPLTGAYNLTAQSGLSKGSGLGPVLVIPAGNALCVLTSAAVQMSGSVSYTQF